MSRKELNENFIYTFKLKNKITSIKKSKESALKVFSKFLQYYVSLNRQKKPSFPNLFVQKAELKETKNSYYYLIITKPYINHPFTVYGNFNSDIINIIIPVGREIGQFNINKVHKQIKNLTKDELKALKYLLIFTINLRKLNFMNQKREDNKFFNCSNIVSCSDKIKEIYKVEKDDTKKFKLIQQTYIKEYKNILNHIKKYFEYLKNSKFNEANKKLKIIKKIYYNPKDIVGHLSILIDIHKLNIKVKNLI
tara:strand:- start:962 stop:1714 length:753 start_codon:yes stop_codon:yes gene_type:complete